MQGVGLLGAKEIWVMDSEDGKNWLDARHAYYRRRQEPDELHFAAIATPTRRRRRIS